MTSTDFELENKESITSDEKTHSPELQTINFDVKSSVSRPSFQVVDSQGRISLINYAISNKNIPSDEDLKYFDPAEYAKKFSFLLGEVECVQLESGNDFKTQIASIYTLHHLLAEENLEVYMYPQEWPKQNINNIVIQTEQKIFSSIVRRILPTDFYHIYKQTAEENPVTAFSEAVRSLWGKPVPSQEMLKEYIREPHVWRNFYYLLKVTEGTGFSESEFHLSQVIQFITREQSCWNVMGPAWSNMCEKLGDLELVKLYCEKFEYLKVRFFLKHETKIIIENANLNNDLNSDHVLPQENNGPTGGNSGRRRRNNNRKGNLKNSRGKH